jgi:hypothetical protein
MSRPVLRRRRIAALALLVLAGAWLVFAALTPARNDRDWSPDQAVLPGITFAGDLVTIRHVRDFEYRTKDDYTPRYYDRTYDLRQLDSVWLMVEPFAGYRGAAHTLLSFGFRDGTHVAVSIEIRKERGETFSAVRGILRQYELMYVVADERDVIGLRANHRRNPVHLHALRATPEQARALFVGMLQRARELQAEPRHYHTLLSNCTTNLVDHVNRLAPGRIAFDCRLVLPAEVDRYAHELGLLRTDLPYAEARARARINERAAGHDRAPDFSQRIRAAAPAPGP